MVNSRSGIYSITCTFNLKCYVGSSVNVRSRLSTHFAQLKSGTHCNKDLQQDFTLYGRSAFATEVFPCPHDEMRFRESLGIMKARVSGPCYNVANVTDKPKRISSANTSVRIRPEVLRAIEGIVKAKVGYISVEHFIVSVVEDQIKKHNIKSA
jgi:group I intron endonuclease